MAWGRDKGFGGNPLDKLVNVIGAVTDGKDKVKAKKKAIKDAPKKAVKKVKHAIGADVCRHPGTKRGKVCNRCGMKLL